MDSSASPSPVNKSLVIDPAQKIRDLPLAAQAAFRRFQASGEPAELDPLIFAILENFNPHKRTRLLGEHGGTMRLIEDLGFDSLAITEVVFFTEDLFEISIANEEIIKVRTLDDLRGFIRTKVAARSTA